MPDTVLIRAQDVDDGDALVLRTKFLEAISEPAVRELVDRADMARARTDTDWCRRFLAHCDLDMCRALDFMLDSVKFRHSMAVNELSGECVRREFFNVGAVWSHGRDRSGARLFIFNARLHYKQSGHMYDEGKRFLVYWIEKIEREELGRRITIVFDMAQAGFANIDIGFIQYLINLFKFYYPDMLQNILVFEMPLLFTATWGVVKNMLPAKSHQLIKFVSRKDIGQWVPDRWLLQRWGGSDTWQYQVDEHVLHMPPSPFLVAEEDGGSQRGGMSAGEDGAAGVVVSHSANGHVVSANGLANGGATLPAVNGLSSKHKVRFDGESGSSGESDATPATVIVNGSDGSSHSSSTDRAIATDEWVCVSPPEQIVFASTSGGECGAVMTVTNVSPHSLAFKVKTTSPDRYRVRPSGGVLAAGSTQHVQLTVGSATSCRHQLVQVCSDRFLLQLARLPHHLLRPSAQQLSALWKSVDSSERHELHFRCAAPSADNSGSGGGGPAAAPPAELLQRLAAVTERLDLVSRQLQQLQLPAPQWRQLTISSCLPILLCFASHLVVLAVARLLS